MPEILTESFCERCGTRYTFESASPKGARLKGLRTVSRGFRNFVMSDDTSLDEAMAAARNETDREATTQQLDAFHKTFNFCMSCRQYTCSNCWNEAEGRCLSCAPSLGQDILPSPFPNLETTGLPFGLKSPLADDHNGHDEPEPQAAAPLAWPTSDLMREEEQAGVSFESVIAEHEAAVEEQPVTEFDATIEQEPAAQVEPVAEFEAAAPEVKPVAEFEAAAPEVEPVAEFEADLEPMEEIDPLARLAAWDVSAPSPLAEPGEEEPFLAEEEPVPVEEEPAASWATAQWPAEELEAESPVAAVEPEPEPETPVEAPAAAVGWPPAPEPVAMEAEPVEAEPVEAEPVEAGSETHDGLAAAAAAQTSELFERFRPGQDMDEAIAAYELTQAAADVLDEVPTAAPTEPEPVAATMPEPVAAPPEPVAIAPTPEPVAAEAEPEPVAAEPEPEPVAAPQPVVAPAPEPEPVATAVAPSAPTPEPQPVAAAPEPEPVFAEPPTIPPADVPAFDRIAATARPEPTGTPFAPEPTPEPEPEREPAAAEVREDLVAQPTWQIVAPEDQPEPEWPAQPQWPAQPEWPAPRPASDNGLAFLGRPAQPTGGMEAIWAESAREVATASTVPPTGPAALGGARPSGGVQPCVSCGLSLSANARFCRRCGTRQG